MINSLPSQLASIPFEFITKWAERHSASFPELKYLRTLFKSGRIQDIKDVYAPGQKDVKPLRGLRHALFVQVNSLESDYISSQKVKVFPSDPTLTGIDAFEAFIKEYFAIFEKSLHNDKQRRALKIYLFPQHLAPASVPAMKSIAKQVGLSYERVRQLVNIFADDCRDILANVKVSGVSATQELSDWFAGIKDRVKDITLASFRKMVGLGNTQPHLERVLCNLLDVPVPRAQNQDSVMSSIKSKLNHNKGLVTKQFRQWVAPVSELMFEGFLTETFEDEELRSAMRTYVLTSDCYEQSVVDGEKYIALKWEYLEFVPSEVARILLDREAYTVKEALHFDTILEKHRALSKLHGKKIIEKLHGIGNHDLILSLGKSGYYKLRLPNEQFVDAITFAREYVQEKMENATKEEFIELCEAEGYTHIYPKNTLLEYYKKFVKIVKGARNINRSECVIKLLAEILNGSGGQLYAADLKRRAEKRLKISNLGSFYVCLRKAENVVWQLQKDSREITVSLMPISVDSFDFNVFKGQVKSADYKIALRDAAINILQNVPGNKLPMVEIVREIETLLPGDIAQNNIYKTFNDTECFIKTCGARRERYLELTPAYRAVAAVPMKPEVPHETLLDRVKKILCREYAKSIRSDEVSVADAVDEMYEIMMLADEQSDGSTIYDIFDRLERYYSGNLDRERMELLFNNIIGEVEPFMKALYKRRTGNTLSEIGLQRVFVEIQKEGIFPDKSDCSTPVIIEFNRLISHVIYKRNTFHDNFRTYKTIFDFQNTIHLFLKLYLLSAVYSILKK